MKKFVSVFLALIIALSVSVVGFAATDTTSPTAAPEVLECDACHKVLKTKSLYNEHYYGGGCDVRFTTCNYCSDRIFAESEAAHYDVCNKYSETCEYCGAEFKSPSAKEEHECKVVETVGNVKAAEFFNKILELLKKVDWADIANKIVEAVKSIDLDGILAKIKPVFEKIASFVGEIELPATK